LIQELTIINIPGNPILFVALCIAYMIVPFFAETTESSKLYECIFVKLKNGNVKQAADGGSVSHMLKI
jgi:hypothetical protein